VRRAVAYISTNKTGSSNSSRKSCISK